VPLDYLRTRYGAQVSVEVAQSLLDAGWQTAVREHDLTPVNQPRIDGDLERVRPDAEFTFSFVVEVAPDVDLKDYYNLPVEKTDWQITDAHVEHELTHVAEGAASGTKRCSPISHSPEIFFEWLRASCTKMKAFIASLEGGRPVTLTTSRSKAFRSRSMHSVRTTSTSTSIGLGASSSRSMIVRHVAVLVTPEASSSLSLSHCDSLYTPRAKASAAASSSRASIHATSSNATS
jgi:hypothetical protein